METPIADLYLPGQVLAVRTRSRPRYDAVMRKKPFTLEDFMAQMDQVKRLGPMDKVMRQIPGMDRLAGGMWMDVEEQMRRMRAIYDSMTGVERQEIGLFDGSRRRRAARGAGVGVMEVAQFIKQYEMTRDMMHRLYDMS